MSINWKKIRGRAASLIEKPVFYFCGVLLLMNVVFTKQILEANGSKLFVLVLVLELMFEGVMIGVLVWAEKREWPTEKKFLAMALGLGVMFIAFLPPGQSPDDINHFRRAYGIADGVIVTEHIPDGNGTVGGELPVEILEFEEMPSQDGYSKVFAQLGETISGEKTVQAYTNTALYNFICYIPQAFAALIGKGLGLSVMAMAYLMKIFDFAVWVFLVYLAIKIIPKFKTVILFIAFLPITLQEATSMAPDAVTIGLSIFLIAYVLDLAYVKKEAMQKWELALLYIVAVIIGFCKIVYLPLVLLYLVIPKERFGSKRMKVMNLVIIAVVVLGLNLLWLVTSSGMLMEFNPGVDSKMQVIQILQNPFGYMMTIFRTINVNLQFWLSTMLGMSLGSWAFNLPVMLFYISFIMLILLLAQRNEVLDMRRTDRAVFAITFVVIVLLIFTSLYVQWTAVGANVIDGIQGRYFLPILLLCPVVLCRNGNNKKEYATLVSQKAVICYSVFIDTIAMITIFSQNI